MDKSVVNPAVSIKTLNRYRIEPLREEYAWDIMRWRYPVPYDFYDPPTDRSAFYVSKFIQPELQFHAVLNLQQQFVGFCSFGIDGQVPGGDYSLTALDIGLGMKPDYTGRGLGMGFFLAILKYAHQTISVGSVRLTVANFNKRAFSLYEKFGFLAVSEFTASRNNMQYTILLADLERLMDLPWKI